MAYLYRLILAFLLAFTSLSAFASFPASTVSGYGVSGYESNRWLGATPQEACTAWATPGGFTATIVGTACKLNTGWMQNYVVASKLACPANSTLSGTACTCAAGYTESGSTCIPIPEPTPVCMQVVGKSVPENPATVELGPFTSAGIVAAMKLGKYTFCDPTGCVASGRVTFGGLFGGNGVLTIADAKFNGTDCDTNAQPSPSVPQQSPQTCKTGTCRL